MSFTFAIPVRNRKHNAVSLVNDNMTSISADHEILIIEDVCSEDRILQGDIKNANTWYSLVDTGDVRWNKSILLNYAIQNATKDFFAVVDADAWFPDGLWDSIWSLIRNRGTLTSFKYDNRQYGEDKKYYNWPVIGIGLARYVHGYNESMFGWGEEDNDILKRIGGCGIQIVDLSEIDKSIFGYHRPHKYEPHLATIGQRMSNEIRNARIGRRDVGRFGMTLENQADYGNCTVVHGWGCVNV